MERTDWIEPRALCYHRDPDVIVGWTCGNCRTVYMFNKVGADAQLIAARCCNHACWHCTARTTHGKLLCDGCRVGDGTPATRMEIFDIPVPKETTTLTAPEGSIGAIGAPDTSSDDSGVAP